MAVFIIGLHIQNINMTLHRTRHIGFLENYEKCARNKKKQKIITTNTVLIFAIEISKQQNDGRMIQYLQIVHIFYLKSNQVN